MRAAETAAAQILEGFSEYRREFARITAGARTRFVAADWRAVQQAARERILLYKRTKLAVCAEMAGISPEAWPEIRASYLQLIADRTDADLAGTFYNSIFRVSTERSLLDDGHAFVTENPPVSARGVPLTSSYQGREIASVFSAALRDCELADAITDIDSEVAAIEARLSQSIPLLRAQHELTLELVSSVFYRNKGAYLVGRLLIDEHVFPVAVALCHEPGDTGVVVDAVLWGESRLSVIFSFTRAYFMVGIDEASALVDYLQRLLPVKKRWELYTSLGFFKQGKTEFVRGYRQHLAASTDQFEIAEGIKGQVMMVFGLASYQIVFKVMKDRFPATKSVSHDDVQNAYSLVKTHDRVGRMADTQEFHNFEFPLQRFEPALLEELLRVCSERVQVQGDTVLVSHLYAERMMTPLNLYLQRCSEFQAQQVLDDYGHAIRELAAANIFPGDMLLKNFGVTRHGRVVFYDYDEICYLTDVNFRDMPESEPGMSADTWFDVGEFDVFPEEFVNFLFPDKDMQKAFTRYHGELFLPHGWQAIQEQVKAARMMDVYPYPLRERLRS